MGGGLIAAKIDMANETNEALLQGAGLNSAEAVYDFFCMVYLLGRVGMHD